MASITVTYSFSVNGSPVGSPVQLTVSPVASPPIDVDVWLAPDANIASARASLRLAKLIVNMSPTISVESPVYPGSSPPQTVAYFNVGVLSPGQGVTLTAEATAGSPTTAGGAYILIWGMDSAGAITFSATKVLPLVTANAASGASITYTLTLGVS